MCIPYVCTIVFFRLILRPAQSVRCKVSVWRYNAPVTGRKRDNRSVIRKPPIVESIVRLSCATLLLFLPASRSVFVVYFETVESLDDDDEWTGSVLLKNRPCIILLILEISHVGGIHGVSVLI